MKAWIALLSVLLLSVVCATAMLGLSPQPPTQLVEYKSEAWDGKFKYGAYSELVASDVLAHRFRRLIPGLADPDAKLPDLQNLARQYKEVYDNLTESQVDAIAAAADNSESDNIYEVKRSVVETKGANAQFLALMPKHKGDLMPVDDILLPDGFKSEAIQFNAHRGLYNEGLGIPQNSVASILNAYVAGIRSVEFDVLETKDNVSVVAHDVVTNRLNGAYDLPPVTVKDYNYAELKGTHVDILNPLGPSPSTWLTSIRTLQRTDDFLTRVAATTRGMTLYVDARNYAPVSIVRLFKERPELGRSAVTKIYPFEMGGGAYSLITEYAKRYTGGDTNAAAREILQIRPNVLLCLGGVPNEATEDVSLAKNLNIGANNFTWANFEAIAAKLPYSTISDPKFNKIGGETIFTEEQLREIEAKTYLSFRWISDFSAVSNVRVLQFAMMPSLVGLVVRKDVAEFKQMPQGDRMLNAVTDNFIAVYKLIMARQLDVEVRLANGDRERLRDTWVGTGFGSSDRFPDFAFAKRSGKKVVQNTLRDFVYGMPATAGEKNDYYAKKMRNTAAITAKIQEVQKDKLPFRYITTDLPTDLRAWSMGLFGRQWPTQLNYRPSGVILAKLTPADIPGFRLPTWVTELFGNARQIDREGFDRALKEYNTLLSSKNQTNRGLLSVEAYKSVPNVLVNRKTLIAIGEGDEPFWDRILSDQAYAKAVADLKTQIASDDERLKKMAADFRTKFGVNVDGSPVKSASPYLDDTVLQLPDDNWDHI